ncbi:MAG: LytTR family DNA-binding domain-containing protein [Lachnospiraceae bacterium]|nr:LytTR family DNA-binding domain-containing protein [Lachnospiraceae bacterium]
MIRVALCDDDAGALPVIAGAAQSAFAAQGLQVKIERYLSGRELMCAMEEMTFQIIMLDIDMPDLNGIELGKRIRNRNETVEIVYVSECEERVFEAFAVYPLGFVRKSNFLNDITDVARLYIRKYVKNQKSEHLKFTTRTAVQVLKRKQIRYIEGSGNYQLVYLNDQAQPVEIKMTMDRLEEQTEPLGFIRIHKGYLVNYLYIQRIQTNQVILKGGENLPIGRSKVKEVKSKYLSLLDS